MWSKAAPFLVLASVLSFARCDEPTIAIGVNLGVDHISAAYISRDHEPVGVIHRAGDKEYQAFMNGILNDQDVLIKQDGRWSLKIDDHLVPTDHSSPETYALHFLTKTLRLIKDEARSASNETNDIAISAISVPEYLSGDQVSLLTDAFKQTEPSFQDRIQVRRSNRAALWAYNLEFCDGLGLSRTECHSEDAPPYPLLTIDVQDKYISLGAFDIIDNYTTPINSTLAKAPQIDWTSDHDLAIIKAWNHIESFINENGLIDRAPKADSSRSTQDWNSAKHHFDFKSDPRAIVMYGNGPRFVFEGIRARLYQEFKLTARSDVLKTHLEPQMITAIGAAYRARLWYHDTNAARKMYSSPPPYTIPHDEL